MRHTAPRPVFLDRTGRRRRVMAIAGAGLAVVLIAGLVLLLTGLSGSSGWKVPGFPDANRVAGTDSTPTPVPGPATPTDATAGTTGTDPSAGTSGEPSASPERSTPRRIPTQTPSHDPNPKPTKT